MTKEDLLPVFKNGAIVRGPERKVLGFGKKRAELLSLGFTKKELQSYCRMGLISEISCNETKRNASGTHGNSTIYTVFVLDHPSAHERAADAKAEKAKEAQA